MDDHCNTTTLARQLLFIHTQGLVSARELVGEDGVCLAYDDQVHDDNVFPLSLSPNKRTTWNGKSNPPKKRTRTTPSLRTSAQGSTLEEKDCYGWWTTSCEDMSKRLWFPTRIDSVGLPLSSSNGFVANTTRHSWSKIRRIRKQTRIGSDHKVRAGRSPPPSRNRLAIAANSPLGLFVEVTVASKHVACAELGYDHDVESCKKIRNPNRRPTPPHRVQPTTSPFRQVRQRKVTWCNYSFRSISRNRLPIEP